MPHTEGRLRGVAVVWSWFLLVVVTAPLLVYISPKATHANFLAPLVPCSSSGQQAGSGSACRPLRVPGRRTGGARSSRGFGSSSAEQCLRSGCCWRRPVAAVCAAEPSAAAAAARLLRLISGWHPVAAAQHGPLAAASSRRQPLWRRLRTAGNRLHAAGNRLRLCAPGARIWLRASDDGLWICAPDDWCQWYGSGPCRWGGQSQ